MPALNSTKRTWGFTEGESKIVSGALCLLFNKTFSVFTFKMMTPYWGLSFNRLLVLLTICSMEEEEEGVEAAIFVTTVVQ